MDNAKNIEDSIKLSIEKAFETILKNLNYTLPISANSRSGAEISDYLEDELVKFFSKFTHDNISNLIGAPKGKTKNPFDFAFDYHQNDFSDFIWADIKAININYEDSNPDLGTPNKIIDFILDNHFYLLFVLIKYKPDKNQTLIIPDKDGKYVKCIFLKDINKSVRINPKPQFQVGINEKEEYRTIEEFIILFKNKYKESLERIIEKAQKKQKGLDETFEKLELKIKNYKKVQKL